MATIDQRLIASRWVSERRGEVIAMRMAEACFRRWPVYLLPVLALTAVGVQRATKVEKVCRSVTTVDVSSSSFLSDLTSVRTPEVGYETPATKTARNINEQMTTASSAMSVAASAGLTAKTNSPTTSRSSPRRRSLSNRRLPTSPSDFRCSTRRRSRAGDRSPRGAPRDPVS